MQSACHGERALGIAKPVRKRREHVGRDPEGALDPWRCDLYRLDRAFPAHAAGGRGVEAPLQPVRVEAVGVDFDRVRREVVGDARGDGRQPFGEAEAERKLLVVARRPHRDRDGLAPDPDLERLLHGDEVLLDAVSRDPERVHCVR